MFTQKSRFVTAFTITLLTTTLVLTSVLPQRYINAGSPYPEATSQSTTVAEQAGQASSNTKSELMQAK